MILDSKAGLAIICLTALEAIALLKGIDGQVFASVIGLIAALAGYSYAKTKG